MPAERESDDDGLAVGHVVIAAGAIAAFIAISLLVAWRLIAEWGGRLHGPAITPPSMPQPTLEANPTIDHHEYLNQERKKLSGYAWIDRDRGIVHIPIDDAMTLLSRRAASEPSDPRKASP
jgi:hypothetical protein